MAEDKPADGIYRICSAMDRNQVVDVAGGSKANGANVMIHSKNANVVSGNHERVKLVTDAASQNQIVYFVHSGKCMDVKGGNAANAVNVQQHAANGTNAQKWRLASTTDSAGAPCWQILTAVNTRYCLDAQGGKNASGTNLMVYEVNSNVQQGDHQKWVFVRDTIYAKSYPVPSNVGLAMSATGDPLQTVNVSGAGATLWPAWECEGQTFQWRYRARYRSASDPSSTWGEWSDWSCPYSDDPTANDGWGDPWADYVTDASGGTLKHAPAGIALSFGSNDRCQVQVEAMRFEPEGRTTDMAVSGPCHGGSVVAAVTVNRLPNVQLHGFTLGADGLTFSYESDFERNGNALAGLTVTCNGATVCEGASFTGLAPTGTLTVPASELRFTPDNGAALSASFTWATCDTSASYWSTGALVYAPSGGLGLDLSSAVADGWRHVVTLSTDNVVSAACYLDVEQDGGTARSECERVGEWSWSVAPPLGRASTVTVAAVNTSNQWGIATCDLAAVGADLTVVNWGDRWVAFDGYADLESSLSRDCEAYQTNGRPRESVYVGEGSAGELTLTTSVSSRVPYKALEALARAGDAVLRTPSGDRWDVTVTGLQQSPRDASGRTVTIEMKERS